ncbi:MAG: MFS transporter [Gammaproteobacteria bacterium]|jgi:MFS family permease
MPSTTPPESNGAQATQDAPSQISRTNILLLGLVSFINDTSSKIILPVLPLFIKDLGGGGLAIGIISGISDSIASLFTLFAGYWSDRVGNRKTFVFSGYVIAAIAKLCFAFAYMWQHVLLLRTIERLGKGIRSAPRDALLASSTHQKIRGRGFGVHRAMDSAGAVFGTLIAFVLFWYLGMSFSHIFIIAGVTGFAALIPLFFVKESDRPVRQRHYRFSLKGLSLPLKNFITVAFLFSLANFSYMFFVLHSQGAFEGKLAVGIPILLYALFNLVYTVLAIPAGILSDRIGRKNVLLAGYGTYILVCLGFMIANSLLMYLLLFVLYGLNYALVNANERAFVSDLAHESARGVALGTYHMATSIAALPAGLIAGLLWDLNPIYTFAFGALLAVAAVIVLLAGIRSENAS